MSFEKQFSFAKASHASSFYSINLLRAEAASEAIRDQVKRLKDESIETRVFSLLCKRLFYW